MKYNFDKVISRLHTHSVKYDLRKLFFNNENVIPMWVADMDFATPDFVVEAVKQRASHEIYGYSIRNEEFNKALISWFQRKHNWKIENNWIQFSPGVVTALSMLVLALTEQKDKIIIQPPVYTPFFEVVEKNNRSLLLNQLILKNGKYTIDFEDLELKAEQAKLLIISNPHNPVARVWKREELMQIAEICKRNNVIVISDEIHCDLAFYPNVHTPFLSLSEEISQFSIATIAPSKTFNIAGLSTSAVVIPSEEIRKKYHEISEALHVWLGNLFGNIAFEVAYNHGDEWLQQMLQYVYENYLLIKEFFQKNNLPIEVIEPEATYLIWLDCRKMKLSNNELIDFFVNKSNLGLNDGNSFGIGGEGFMRMNIACPKEIINIALQNILKAFNIN